MSTEYWRTTTAAACGEDALDVVALVLLQIEDAQLMISTSADVAVLVSYTSIETSEGFEVQIEGDSPAGFAYCGAVDATDALIESLASLSSLGSLLLRSELAEQLDDSFMQCGIVEQQIDSSNPEALKILRYLPPPLDALRSGAQKGLGEREDNLEKRAAWAKKRGLSE